MSAAAAVPVIPGYQIPQGRINPQGEPRAVRADHVARYRWAAAAMPPGLRALDLGCGVGYGAAILAERAAAVIGIDRNEDFIRFGRAHYAADNLELRRADLTRLRRLPRAHFATCFELLEHLDDPAAVLRLAGTAAGALLASVPNEEVWPWQPRLGPEHRRHYRRGELAALLAWSGWRVRRWWGQRDGTAPVRPGAHGRTLVVEAVRTWETPQ